MNNTIMNDIEKHPLDWVMECPKCGSTVNARYALSIAPYIGVAILPYFYCHCTRFQTMIPRPSKVASRQTVITCGSFTSSVLMRMINYILRRN
jgi:C4-type Zn-finger protein